MKTLAIAILLFGSIQAYATRTPDHCKPEPKPRDPPAVSKSETRTPQSRSDTVDRPCERGEQAPVWCRVLK